MIFGFQKGAVSLNPTRMYQVLREDPCFVQLIIHLP